MKKYMVFGFRNVAEFEPGSEPSKEERQEIMNKWMTWKEEMGELLVDMGSPLLNGKAISKHGVEKREVSNLSGFMTIRANDVEHAIQLLNKSPLFGNGHAQNYELFECLM